MVILGVGRHGAVTKMPKAGQPVATVSAMVDHRSSAMTYGVYDHVMPGTKQEAAE